MSPEDKEHWEEMARQDKARYLKQKEEYAGPWKVPADMKKPKDPTAPKKPTPAYFSFSNERRQVVKKENPTASNGEISKILSKMWKEADEETRTMYVEKEKEERKMYNQAVEEWKKDKKESGRENWWEHDTSTTDGGGDHKRARLDILADLAPQHEIMAAGRRRLDPSDHGGPNRTAQPASNSSFGQSSPSVTHEQLSALSSHRGLQAIASLLPSLMGPGYQSSNNTGGVRSQLLPEHGRGNISLTSPQVMDVLQQLLGQQQASIASSPSGHGGLQSLGAVGSFSLENLLSGGQPSSTNSSNNASSVQQLANQQGLLTSLMGGPNNLQQQQSTPQDYSSTLQGLNMNELLSLLGSCMAQVPQQHQLHGNYPTQHPLQGLQAFQLSLLQQGLQSNFLQQLQPPPPARHSTTSLNANPTLAALLGQHLSGNSTQPQDQQYQFLQQSRSEQLTQSLLQNLLQQGSNSNPASSVPSTLEDAISRLVRGNQQF